MAEYNQQPQQPSAVYRDGSGVTVQTVPAGVMLSSDPVNMVCPNCGQSVETVVSYDNGMLTYLLAGGLCLIGCWLGCCLIPTCVKSCKDAIHSCPQCKAPIGRYKRI